MKFHKIKSFAKVNLTLKILNKYSNGYHKIDCTKLQKFSEWYDSINKDGFEVEASFGDFNDFNLENSDELV